jgi:hypothetical protein
MDTTKEDRSKEISSRIDELDALLAKVIEPSPADNPRTIDEAEMNYFSDRREERRFLMEELNNLLKS